MNAPAAGEGASKPSFPLEIKTERLLLRPPVAADAGSIFEGYTRDPEVSRYMIWTPHASIETTREFVASCMACWRNQAAFPYVMNLTGSDEAIGMLEARPAGHRVVLGYVLARRHWGIGLMPEALRAFTKLALLDLGFFRVEATCDLANAQSARVLEKAGFIREGRLGRYTVHPNLSAEPRDCWLYAACR